jgi:hypothetical protein
MINILSKMSEAELIDQGYLILEHRPNITTYRPTDKFRRAMAMSMVPFNQQPCIYETANGTFYKNGQVVRMLGTGEPLVPEVHDAVLDEYPNIQDEMESE